MTLEETLRKQTKKYLVGEKYGPLRNRYQGGCFKTTRATAGGSTYLPVSGIFYAALLVELYASPRKLQ